jgi:endopeptidase Clp ATP-binding regulatory subunit ClpX
VAEPNEQAGGAGGPGSTSKLAKLNLNLKPEELEAYLEAFVVRQEAAKAVLATKVSTHFNRIRYLQESGADDAPSAVGMIKNNVLLIGPTGVGKTYLVKLIANKIGAPFVKGDATKFSETGYVGGDVEDLVRDLVQAAGDDLELAQCGIIYVDEVDKIASSQSLIGPDVSRTGVQRALLKPMEETEVDLKVPHDPISQLQAIENYRKTGKREKRTVNTKNILFIMSGAFNGLEEIIKKRLRQHSIGFGAACEPDKAFYLSQVTAQDLVAYGFETEFVGRLPVVVVLEELTAEDLFHILTNPNNPVILSKKRDFAAYDITLRFEDEALRLIAQAAAQEKTGARALVGAMERVLLGFEKRLPSTGIRDLLVTAEMVQDPAGQLDLILAGQLPADWAGRFEAAGRSEAVRLADSLKRRAAEVEKSLGLLVSDDLVELVLATYAATGLDADLALRRIRVEADQVRAFQADLNREGGFNAAFDEEALYTVLRVARQAGLSPKAYLAGIKEELILGLQLVRDKTGLDEFILTREAVLNTSEYVRSLVTTRLPLGA